ncbi:PREDICTED: F-box/kelch-repeat protein At1g57790-like [Tarenaya hassleriana]|uniref:F-box/kelch-repeat protein At1g57790-like n=1 Tax=Tarenaya hassleriana TaxID=28532 RepID=UPI00053C7D9E|nr:PREDICTED: F-box/kelch-repeat protein At1g57790-like [Tarenaya hassleriana]
MVLTSAKRRMLSGNAEEEEGRDDTWSALPTEILNMITSRLILEDNVRASAVCKSWLRSAVSVRVSDRPPWLMYFPKAGDMYEFFDPSSLETSILELPELNGCLVRYSNDGWLLMQNPRSDSLFFFNPFTRDLIDLPTLEDTPFTIAFSSAPTSGNCWLFTGRPLDVGQAEISTLLVGMETEWTTELYETELPFFFENQNKIVFSNDRFYCLSSIDWIAAFDPFLRSWEILNVNPPGCPYNHYHTDKGWRKFLAEHEGEVIAVFSRNGIRNPHVYRLDMEHSRWRNTKNLEGMAIFASSLSSQTRSNVAGQMRGNVCLANPGYFRSRRLPWSADADDVDNGCLEQWPYSFIWIDAPKNF